MTALVLTALTAGCVAVAPRAAAVDDAVGGPEWKTSARRGVGAATASDPARLTGVAAEDHERYDRVTFTFEGRRPGYHVMYGRGAGPRLRIILDQVVSGTERRLTPRMPAVREVEQRLDAGSVTETVVTVVDSGTDPLPFRVGLSVGTFYVDIAHSSGKPGEFQGQIW